MDKNKIALLNIQKCDSHGAVLLAYALEQILFEQGYDAYNLNYKYAGRIVEKNFHKRFIQKLKIKLTKTFHLAYANNVILGNSVKKEYDLQSKNFDEFRKRYLHLTKEIKDVNDPILKNFNTFIVGSDVVWKPEIARCIDREMYFLKSAPKTARKIAYAGSIGTDDLDFLNQYDSFYRGAFDDLDFISIREQSMIPFVQKYTEKKVVSTIDPVFLLSPEDYMKIEKNSLNSTSGKKYVYVYLIGENRTALEKANELAKNNGLAVLLDLNSKFEYANIITQPAESAISAGPAEFLYNVRNAEYVITDSFHATAFSILFNTPFAVFKRGKISVRMDDLIKRFNIEDRMYTNQLNLQQIDWNRINNQIICERNYGIQYLQEAISYGHTKRSKS